MAPGNMPLPGCGVVNKVQVFGVAHTLEILWASGVGGWFGLSGLFALFQGPESPLLSYVTDSFYFHPLDAEQIPEVATPLISDTDITHPDRFDRWGHEMIYGLCLQLRPRGTSIIADGHAS